jgi:NADPH:quinone reductase-like Zn-dependent oxidoreductase
MRAVQLTNFGGSEGIDVRTLDNPKVTQGKVLIEVHAAGVNPVDWKIREGMMQFPLPLTLGGDFSGTVKQVGAGVSNLIKGDEVYGQAGIYRGGSGSFAEFVVAEEKTVALKPKKLTDPEGAALPLAGVSALQALIDHINLSDGQKILIHGGGGGIGHLAIQIAKHLRAYVATTCSNFDVDFVKKLGADKIIDYQKEDFEELIRDYDAVVDLVGSETYRKSYRVLRGGGVLVSLLEEPDDELMKQFGITVISQKTQVSTTGLNKLSELVDRGVIKVHIEKSFPLEQAREALAYLEKKHPKGKIVLKVK